MKFEKYNFKLGVLGQVQQYILMSSGTHHSMLTADVSIQKQLRRQQTRVKWPVWYRTGPERLFSEVQKGLSLPFENLQRARLGMSTTDLSQSQEEKKSQPSFYDGRRSWIRLSHTIWPRPKV
jgi:hypothetical protein